MKTTIIFLLFLICINSFAQVKSVEILQRPSANEVLEAILLPDSTINIQMTGADNSYDNSTKIMTIFSGTPKEYYTFICELEEFAEENEPKAHTRIIAKIGGMQVSIEKFLGSFQFLIYEKAGAGYHRLSPSWLTKFKEKFTEWANNKNIPFQ
jgi:hypothetical protein